MGLSCPEGYFTYFLVRYSALGKATDPYWENAAISPLMLSLCKTHVPTPASRKACALEGSSFPKKAGKIVVQNHPKG